ncbi:MAG: hypothetical protein J5850_03565, partial [Clostridia bacterium]|nr:hypothetical protein [Clostridia bacterium]
MSFDAFIWRSQIPDGMPFELSNKWRDLRFTGKSRHYPVADTWYPTWASDGKCYSPFTDGVTCGVSSRSWASVFEKDGRVYVDTMTQTGQAAMEGDDPENLTLIPLGIEEATCEPYRGRYPCGSLVYNGIWYYGTYCLGPSGSTLYGNTVYNWPHLGPFVGFRISYDLGKTWVPCPHKPDKPLFGECGIAGYPVKIGSPHFVDFGKNMEYSPDGKAYLVAHGSDLKFYPVSVEHFAHNSWITGDQIYLIRVAPSPDTINNPDCYEFFAGKDSEGNALWTSDFSLIKPLLEWQNNMGCVTVTYNPGLNRYFMAVTDGGNTCAKMNTYILESESLTGEWKLVTYMKDFGEQAYFVNFPSKFISSDGRKMWICYSGNFAKG